MKTTVKDKRGTTTYSGGKVTSSTPASSNSGSSGGSGGSTSGNNTPAVTPIPGGGYAYIDDYGFSHVVKDYNTAAKYAKQGTDIYDYGGNYSGGYARDNKGVRIPLPIPESTPFGSDLKNNVGYQSVMPRTDFDNLFKGALGDVASKPLMDLPKVKNTMVASTNPLAPLATSMDMPVAGAKSYTEGGINYENRDGGIYKDGRLVPEENYKYIPQAIGGTRPDQVATQVLENFILQQQPTAATTGTMNMPLFAIPEPELPELYRPREFDPDRDYRVPDELSRMDGVTWIPTNQAINQFNQAEQNRYNASLNDYNSAYQQWQDRSNIAWEQYQEQQRQRERAEDIQREEAANAAAFESEEQAAMQKMAMDRWKTLGYADEFVSQVLGVDPGTDTADWRYSQASLNLRELENQQSNIPNPKDQQQEALGLFMSSSEMYESGKEYLADIQRYKSDLIKLLGVNGYQQLEKDAISMDENSRTGSKFQPGSPSPIKELLGRVTVNPNNPASQTTPSRGGNSELSSWVRQGMQIAGVGQDWYEPLIWIAEHESNGDPNIVNPQKVWYSDQHGYQNAKGLFQTMEPTFNAHKVQGYDNIFDPVANTVAAINYIKSKYGHPSKVVQTWAQRGGF
jgi:hypothetical protein